MIQDVFRFYSNKECDTNGIPLDWDRCRTCKASGGPHLLNGKDARCPTCGGYGSLKAAALALCHARFLTPGVLSGRYGDSTTVGQLKKQEKVRCEDCAHPMSDGVWEDAIENWVIEDAELSRFVDNHQIYGRHWSPCDKGCIHPGPQRIHNALTVGGWDLTPAGSNEAMLLARIGALGRDWPVEASWRKVEVRTLDWAHDLRPESLAVLCTRCFATR